MRRLPILHTTLRHLIGAAILSAPLAGCGFDKFDGRWVANVPPTPKCCPMRVVLDVDTHKFTGTVEDCDAATTLQGHVDGHGDATLHVRGDTTTVRFAGENFTTTMPTDRCRRPVLGNRGG